MKTIGIIGGLGPETTADFYLELVRHAKDLGIPTKPPVLMWSVPITYEDEQKFLIESKNIESYLPHLLDGAKKLGGKTDFIVLPCNSLLVYIEEIRQAVAIPVLSILDEVVDFLEEKGCKDIALLGTQSTVSNNLYQAKLSDVGITTQVPDCAIQKQLNVLISRLALGEYGEDDIEYLRHIIDMFLMEKHVDYVLLACTDLQIALQDRHNDRIIDTMRILAHATIKYAADEHLTELSNSYALLKQEV